MSVKNKTNKNYKRSQKGRSMVEMLGVLAIIGVLSVGGVYAYGVAMKKHKANELLHQASMLATTISAQIQSKGELPTTIENFGDGKYGTFNPPSEVNAEQFTLKVTDMDSAVCEQTEKMAGGMVRKAECSGTTLTLTFNEDLSRGVSADDSTSSDEDTLWDPSQATPCESDNECDSSKCEKCADGICMPVLDENNPACSSCPTGYMTLMMENPTCVPCYWNMSIPVLAIPNCETECSGKREVRGEGENAMCVLTSCPSGYWLDEEFMECVSCNLNEPIPVEEVPNVGSCSNRTTITDENGNEVSVLNGCTSGYTFDEDNGYCVTDCSAYPGTSGQGNGGSVPAKPECKCAEGMTWDTSTNSCQCAEGYYENRDGGCSYNCNYWYPGSSPAMYGSGLGGYTPDDRCRCGGNQHWDDIKKRCECDSGYGLMDTNFNCTRCGVAQGFVPLDEDDCNGICPNREMKDGKCACSGETFLNLDGSCISCSSTVPYRATPEECAKCGDTREMIGNKCYLACTEGQFRYADYCKDCSDEDAYSVTAEECAKCADTGSPRFMNHDLCYPCSVSYTVSGSEPEECAACGALRRYDAATKWCIKT